ncbi:TPA: hypothetical protein ACOELY_004056 [Enterobacter kobei]
MSVKRYDIGTFGGMRMELSSDGAYVRHDDYAALETRCAEMASENAGLKDAISCHAVGFTVCEACGEENISGNDDVCRALDETPATDAFLAEVRAQGVEMFAASLKVAGGQEHPYSAVANEFAAQFRKGGQS